MIYLLLGAGLLGLLLALYGRQSDTRFLGGLAAFAGLVTALLNWGAW
ncbi:hypothetical protein [Streptomyces chryseus]|uniref:Uncharacterized protein n=1 Tax=Streptomyces chryseus TaxID=68186 RepID=A0ABQ3DHR9_9ACTN|nr:hypothetical protein [Streptomyces chryseus]GHA94285.1 hypothetical protein GCM10010346_16300 [Streptomyces chryseus]